MERTPLNNKEYYALRQLFGVVNGWEQCQEILRPRCKQTATGWRDYRLILAKSVQLMEALLRTVPLEKLKSIQMDMTHARCEVKVVQDFTGKAREQGMCYVPEQALARLVGKVIDMECFCCDKTAAEGKKCPILRDIEACYPWPMAPKGTKCPLAGLMTLDNDA